MLNAAWGEALSSEHSTWICIFQIFSAFYDRLLWLRFSTSEVAINIWIFFFFFFESLRGLLKALFSNCYHANKLASFVNHMQRIPKQECTVYIVQWVQYTCMCVCVCSAAEAYSTCFTFLISTIPWDEWTWYDLKHTGVHILLSYWPMFLITYTASPDTWTNDSLSHLASWITKQ